MKDFSPLAAIDAGSNTIHLVVVSPTADGRDLRTLDDELELVRLGADVSATGAIGTERAARAIAAIRAQAARARELGATTVLGIATEGVRAAANADDFLRRVQAETGVHLELVTGEQEAALTYWGVTGTGAVATSGTRRVVLDLGGGSLEVVVGTGADIEWRVSLPLGSGTIHDRYAPADPPLASELDTARDAVATTLAPQNPPLPVEMALACGGTATTLAALAKQALNEPTANAAGAADNATGYIAPALTMDRLGALLDILQSHPAADISQRYRIDEARARLLGAGVVVLQGAMRRLGVEALRVSLRGIREGALLAYLRAGDGWPDAATRGVLPLS